jgi:hypothetical protein
MAAPSGLRAQAEVRDASRAAPRAALHREAVGAHVAGRIDPAVGRDVRSRRGTVRRSSRGSTAHLVGVGPANVEADLALHRDPFVRARSSAAVVAMIT